MSIAIPRSEQLAPTPFATEASAPPEPGSPLEGTGAFHRRLLRSILRERSALRWLVGCGLVQTLLGLGTPWLLARVIDTALPNQASNQLAVLLVLSIAGALHLSWCGWAHGNALVLLQQRVVCACQEDLLRRFLRIRYAASQRYSFGETNITLNAVSATALALLGLVLGLGTTVLMALGATAVVALSFPVLALIAVAACGVMAVCASVFALREAKLSRATLAAAGVEHEWLHVVLSAVPTLRASGATSRAMRRWTELVYRTARAGLEQTQNHVAQGIVLSVIPQLLCMGTSMWLMSSVLNGTATLGTVMMVNTLLGSLTHSAVAMVRAVTELQRLRPQFERIDELLVASDGSPARSPWHPLESAAASRDAIVFDDVWFRYSTDLPWVLQGHSQVFAKDTMTYLRAESGAGKTTLLRLAAGLLVPERGQVRVLGLDPSSKTRLVTYLPQNAVLLEASIAANLALLSGQPIERVLQVAEWTGLSRLLAQLPLGLATPVALRGGNLSAGQCQLVVLTAAFASASPVILLDEATAQIDAETRSRIDWVPLIKGRSVIVVTHE